MMSRDSREEVEGDVRTSRGKQGGDLGELRAPGVALAADAEACGEDSATSASSSAITPPESQCLGGGGFCLGGFCLSVLVPPRSQGLGIDVAGETEDSPGGREMREWLLWWPGVDSSLWP